ncbi:phage tail tube protein [Marinibacterium sp. SX1]|uniref:phage tail tube protein n=1 Tax=Marinibacterium sp. SX1 TaxID=3388424 RepID=UPI003D171F39
MTASSGAVRGYGSTVRIGVGETPTWTKLVGVEEFEFPDQTPENIDTTWLESPDDTMEAIRGMKQVASWSLDIQYVPGSDTDVALSAVEASEEMFLLELTARGAAAVTYAAYLNSWRPTGISAVNKMMANATFTVMAKVEA